MQPHLIERLFTELFTSRHLARELTVIWHSGEPLTLPPSYYDEAIAIILRLKEKCGRDDVELRFDIQTNGVLIDEKWCQFFKRHEGRLAVGISCDGPAVLHDRFRVNWHGGSTLARTVRGMDLLQAHGLRYKIIAVVTARTVVDPEPFYDFFFHRRKHLTGFHFNILARGGASTDPDLSYRAEDRAAYYSFYRRMLDLSHAERLEGESFDILNFSLATARLLGSKTDAKPSDSSAPLRSLNVDAAGNVTTFYAGLSVDVLRNEYGDGRGLSLGNILETSLEQMVGSPKLSRIMADFERSDRSCRESCDYFAVCSGGFEITKKESFGTFEACETVECLIHVKTLVDAVVGDIEDHLESELVRCTGRRAER
jgi:uncharacterized protein